MVSLTLIWLQFAVCAVLIGLAGFQLSRYGDVIAHRTGLSGGWIGMALLATANVGCQMHLQSGSTLPVRHWIELIDERLRTAS